ncbi:hypothetical protein GF337_06150, partial [candidate division KSB1 bacterium]|nr:hypothetical protein [candidate division KSB1 bacterium]
MYKKLAAILLIFILSSCASNKQMKRDRASDSGKMGYINENFDPLILNDYELKIKQKQETEAKSDVDDSILDNISISTDRAAEVTGYRVQICAVPNEETAREIQREAILKMNENIYLIYDSPYYKVRIGDCTSRFEADKLQQLAISKGFDQAWVVKTRVKANPREISDEQPPVDEN